MTAIPRRASARAAVGLEAVRDVDRDGRLEPVVDDPVEQLGRAGAALQRLAVELEEEALVGVQERIGEVAPPGAHRLAEVLAERRQEDGECVALALLDRSDHLDPEAFARAEVVDQHAVAGPDRGRQLAQREVADAALLDVLHRSFEQLFASVSTGHGAKCTIWYIMPKPVTVSIDVPQSRPDVYAFLAVMANHEPFTDHMLVDWTYPPGAPAAGVGSRVQVHSTAGGRREPVDIEVIAAAAPERIVERNVSAGGKRVGLGTYELTELPAGGTRVAFTYAWEQAPFVDRALAPLVRALLRRGNERAMARLAEQLPAIAPRRPLAYGK